MIIEYNIMKKNKNFSFSLLKMNQWWSTFINN